MKLILVKLSVIVVLLSYGMKSHAQYVIKAADAKFELSDYIKAIDLYEQAYHKKVTLHAAERLAQCYALVQDYKETESWYAIASSMPGSDPSNMLAYAGALKNNGKFAEAKAAFVKYKLKQANIVSKEQMNSWMASCDSASFWMRNPVHFTVNNLKSINTPKSDWGAVVYENNIVFSSDRDDMPSSLQGSPKKSRPFLKFDGVQVPDKNVYGRTGNSYLHLYIQRSGIGDINYFPATLNNSYHTGPACFTGDEKEMFYTLTKIPEHYKKSKGTAIRTINVEIYSCKKDTNGKWTEPVSFKYNNPNDYSVGDPYITKDGKMLYFSSNMPGGKGGTDIYYCKRNTDGTWGTAVNLTDINTAGNERTPTLDSAGNLYFSSDGLIGMGGLDIFKTKLVNGKWAKPLNMGYPFNSPQDDFAYNPIDKADGFFASNRFGGLGSDDIYSFSQRKPPVFRLTGVVYDKSNNAKLPNAMLSLAKADGTVLNVQTDVNGTFNYDLDTSSSYTLICERTGFQNSTTSLSTIGFTSSTTITRDFYLEQIILNKEIVLENIYYDFDKSNIRPDAEKKLDKVVTILKNNPTMWIELGSHTDSRGGSHYNLLLSQRRANAAVQYIASKGINKNRITAKGYGDTRLVNACTVNVKCSEKEYQADRRTEFHIVKY